MVDWPAQDFEIEMAMMREFRCPNLVRYFDGAVIAKRREAFIVRTVYYVYSIAGCLGRLSHPA